ncbi:MAG: PASTA domain-containing protein, partial [Phocaeicola sp.]
VIDFGSLTADRFSVSKGMTYVPNVVNQEYETAKRLAEENAMSIQQADSQYSDTIPRNWVYAQSPDVGYEVEEGTVLVVAMSLGKQQVIVPSVEGLMHEEAIRLLEECGLSYELTDVDSNVAEGAVVTQSIASGEVVDIGTIVMLGVSTGVLADVDTTIEVEVPDLTDISFAQAQELLNDLKLYIVKETETYSSTIQQGNIISHDPEKGTIVHQGDTIRVTVSKGIQRAFVEDVWLKEEAYAKEIMENNGLTVEIRYEENEDVRAGCIISQSIEANTYVDWGSKIVLVVSKGSTIANNPAGDAKEKGVEATATSTSTPTPTPTPRIQYRYRDKIVTTDGTLTSQGYQLILQEDNYTEWVESTTWTTEQRADSNVCEKIEEAIQYRYTTLLTEYAEGTDANRGEGWTTINQIEEWTPFSEWTTTPPSIVDYDGYDVEIAQFAIYKTQYRYYRYKKVEDGHWYFSPNDNGGNCEDLGWSDTDNTPAGYYYDSNMQDPSAVGWTYWNGIPMEYPNKGEVYYRQTRQVLVSPTYYVWRTRTYRYEYSRQYESNFSEWSFSAPPSGYFNKEERHVYKYKTRTYIDTTYTYWTPYSDWSYSQVISSSTREVETRQEPQ